MLEETNVLIEDLKLIRNALAANVIYHQSTDIANAQCNMSAPRYRPITTSSDEALQRVNGILGDYLLAQHMEEPVTEQPSEQAEEEAEDANEPLDPNPLGSIRMNDSQRKIKLAGKNLGLHEGKTDEELAAPEAAE